MNINLVCHICFCLIIFSMVCLFLNLSLVSGSQNHITDIAPGLPKLASEEVYTWNTLRDYVEYYDNNIESIRKHYPELEEHILKSQWYSIVSVLECEYDIDEQKLEVFPPRIRVKDLPEIIDDVKSLWKKKNFIFASLNQEEFVQKCVITIRNLIHHPKIVIQTHDPTLLRSLCHDSVNIFFNPAMLYEELKLKIDFEGQRFPVSSLTCVDQERIRFGQWSAIVHLHALDSEDGRDRIFNSDDSDQNNSLLPYRPPSYFAKGIEEELFETICQETLDAYYSRIEEKKTILSIFCKDARKIYYSDPLEIIEKYNIYGKEIGKLKISEIRKKASRVNPPSLLALNLIEYRILRISQWLRIVDQLRMDRESDPQYHRIIGELSPDPRIYNFTPSLNFEEFESNCKSALKLKVNKQENKGIFLKGIKNSRNSSDQLEEFDEWERLYVIEIVELETFCRDSAALYYETNQDLFAVPREIPLIAPPKYLDSGRSLGKSDSREFLDLNKERSINGSTKIMDIKWRIQASTYLWEKLITSRVHSRLEDAITNIQWEKIKQQTDGFLFFNIGIKDFLPGISEPLKSVFSFSDDPFGMYNQCIHVFSESRRRFEYNQLNTNRINQKMTNLANSTREEVKEISNYGYKWTISNSVSEKILDKGINSENLEDFPEIANTIKKLICMESVKEYFEDAIQSPFILDEVDFIKFKVQMLFPDNPFPDATDPKLPDPDGDLEAQEQWKYIYDSSLNLRNQIFKNSNFNENVIILTRKMPLSYLEFRHSKWRPQHECYQDMAINCIQSSWPIVEENWKVQKVQTDLASALAIFCDSVAIDYFERKKQWRQLINLINNSQKYSSLFEWIRRGFYLPDTYKVLKIPIKHGKECALKKEEIKNYSENLVRCFLDLVKYRYLAPFTSDIKKICDSIALDMSVSTTRGTWIGLIPVDSEVLKEMERLSTNLDKKDNNEDEALGYHPTKNNFVPKNKFARKDEFIPYFSFKKGKENQEAVSMKALKPPIKTTVIPKIRLLQYKEIVEKDKDDIPLNYPIKHNQRADWRKYLNKGFDKTDYIVNEKNIGDFYKTDWAKPYGLSKMHNSKYQYVNYIPDLPRINKRLPIEQDHKEAFYHQLSKSIKKEWNENKDDIFKSMEKLPAMDDLTLQKNYRFANLNKIPLSFQKRRLPPEINIEEHDFIYIPAIKKPKPLSKKEIYERAKNIHLEDELEESIDVNQITNYINRSNKKYEHTPKTIYNEKFEITKEKKVSKNKLLPSIEIIHSVIKSSEYYNIIADCITPHGYYIGNTLNEEDLVRGARFVYRCLRMDGHFVNPQTAYRIWLRSELLRKKSSEFIPTAYKKSMRNYIKKRSPEDNQTYCPGKNQDELDIIADTIATAAYVNNIFLVEYMPQICIIAKEFLYGKIKTLSQCVRSFKRHIIKYNGEYVVKHNNFPLICSLFESEWGKSVFSTK